MRSESARPSRLRPGSSHRWRRNEPRRRRILWKPRRTSRSPPNASPPSAEIQHFNPLQASSFLIALTLLLTAAVAQAAGFRRHDQKKLSSDCPQLVVAGARANGRKRGISPVRVRPDGRPLTEPSAGAQLGGGNGLHGYDLGASPRILATTLAPGCFRENNEQWSRNRDHPDNAGPPAA